MLPNELHQLVLSIGGHLTSIDIQVREVELMQAFMDVDARPCLFASNGTSRTQNQNTLILPIHGFITLHLGLCIKVLNSDSRKHVSYFCVPFQSDRFSRGLMTLTGTHPSPHMYAMTLPSRWPFLWVCALGGSMTMVRKLRPYKVFLTSRQSQPEPVLQCPQC